MELVDILDSNYRIVGQKSKNEAHQLGLLHRTVIAGVKDSKNRFLLVTQADFKQDAKKYVFPVGGHVQAGESIIDALKREVLEEISFQDFKYRKRGEAHFNRTFNGMNENHYFTYFEIISDESPLLGDESHSYVYYTEKELKNELTLNPYSFGEGFFVVVKIFYPEFKLST